VALLAASAALAESTCPSRDGVERALAELASHEPSAPRFDERARASVVLEDRGESFRVTIDARSRDYADAERDCERRARLAAVYIALVLTGEDEPSATGEQAPSPATEASSPRKTEAPPTVPERPRTESRDARFSIDAAARVAFSPSDAALVVLPGAEVGAAFMPDRLGARLAVAVPFSQGTLAVGAATARFARYPLSLAARYRIRAAHFALLLDAGLESALVRVSREDGTSASTRFDFGARAGAWLGLATPRVSPFLSALVEVVPVRFPLALEPDGVVAKTPLLWLGATAGVSVAFD